MSLRSSKYKSISDLIKLEIDNNISPYFDNVHNYT